MGADEAAEEEEEEEEDEEEADGDSGPFGACSVFECDPGMDALAVGRWRPKGRGEQTGGGKYTIMS